MALRSWFVTTMQHRSKRKIYSDFALQFGTLGIECRSARLDRCGGAQSTPSRENSCGTAFTDQFSACVLAVLISGAANGPDRVPAANGRTAGAEPLSLVEQGCAGTDTAPVRPLL